ncbi:hypothetical protein EON80_03875 [bacterium]|nr:MAG: hypothetical protein EON80_03875 [bacterium]
MHPQLEAYLQQIEKHLKGLTPSEKEGQLLEITQHLQTLTARERAVGLSETEAVKVAMQRFGKPAEIGSDIIEASAGKKLSLPLGLLLGALLGMLLAFTERYLNQLFYNGAGNLFWSGSFNQCLCIAALSGAAASLIGRRFTRRYLTRPVKALPILPSISHVLVVSYRMASLGLLRGAVAGTIFGATNTLFGLADPQCTVYLRTEQIQVFLVMTTANTIGFALVISFVSACAGLILGATSRPAFKVKRA